MDAAELSTHCAHSPFKALGGTELLTAAELAPLLTAGVPGSPWQGTAAIGGREREVLAVTSHATVRGAVLVLVREDGAAPVGEDGLAVAQALWDLITGHFDRFATEALPGALARSRAAADTRARVIAELTASHTAALSGVLGVLRSRALDDTTARASATDLAASALIEMRAEQRRDRAIAEEPPRRPSSGSPANSVPCCGTAASGWTWGHRTRSARSPRTWRTARGRSSAPCS